MEAAPLNVWALLAGLQRCWLQAGLLGLFCAGVTVAALWYFAPPPKQTVQSLLHVSSNAPYILFPRNDNYSFEMYQRSQVALAKSRFVLLAALKMEQPEAVAKLSILQTQPEPVQWLEKVIQVDFSVSPETMRISMQGDKTQDMVVLVNAVTRAYLNKIVDKEKNNRVEQIEKLKKVYRTLDEGIQAKKQILQDVSKVAGTGNPQIMFLKQQFALQQLGQTRSEMIDIKSQVRKLGIKIGLQISLEKGGEDLALALYCNPPSAYPSAGTVALAVAGVLRRERVQETQVPAHVKEKVEQLINDDPEFRSYLKQETYLIENIKAFRKVASPDADMGPLQNKEAELMKVRETMKAKREETRPRYLERVLREARTTPAMASNLAQLQLEQHYWLTLENHVAKDIEQLNKDELFLNSTNLDLESIKDELASQEDHWKKVRREIDVLEVEKSAPARITLLDDAVVYHAGGSITRLAMMGAGGMGAFALVCLAFGWWEVRARRVNSPTQLVQTTGIQLIGTLPDYSKVVQTQRKSVDRYESVLSDSVDAVRTLLLFISRMENIRTVLVTSAVAGEGKTFSACHLAASLARSGRKTLLMDCDIRNPAVHKVFNVEIHPGLSEILRAECDLARAVRTSDVDNLFILPAGQADILALRMLALEKTGEVFKELKEQYDFIVVDSAPVLPVPDALLVAQHTDAAVFSILRDVSQFPKVQAAYQRLGNLGIRILGAIFNGNKEETSDIYNYALPSKTV